MPGAGIDVLAVQPPRERRRPGVRGLDGRDLHVPLVLSLTMLAGATAFFLLGLFAPVPNTTDEAVYIELARHLGSSGRFEILGVPFPPLTYGPAFVALIAPILRLADSAREAYLLVRALNSIVFASAVVPTFLIATRVVSRRTALIVAAATVALPAGLYSTKVMTETLALTVVLWSVLAAIRVLERPSRARQLVLVLCVAILPAARFELLILGPTLALTCVVAAEGRVRANTRRLAPLLVGTIIVAAATAGLLHETSRAASGAGAHGFQIYRLSALRFGQTLVGSLGAIDLYTGVLPFGCLLFLCAATLRRERWVSPELRRVVLLTSAGTASLLVTSSAYLVAVPAKFRPPIPSDRYTFYLAPLMLVVFAAWLETGTRRSSATKWTAVAASGLPVLAALAYFGRDTLTFSGVAFLPWIGLGNIQPLLGLLPITAYCVVCGMKLIHETSIQSFIKPMLTIMPLTLVCAGVLFVLAPTFSPPPGWLDAHTSPGTIAVWGVTPSVEKSQALGEIVSANSNLAAVYFLRKPDTRGFQQVEKRVRPSRDGTLLHQGRPLTARYVLTDAKTRIVGTLIARRDGFAIYEAHGPVRLARRLVRPLPSTS